MSKGKAVRGQRTATSEERGLEALSPMIPYREHPCNPKSALAYARRNVLTRFVCYHGVLQTSEPMPGQTVYERALEFDAALIGFFADQGWSRYELMTTINALCRFDEAWLDTTTRGPGIMQLVVLDPDAEAEIKAAAKINAAVRR